MCEENGDFILDKIYMAQREQILELETKATRLTGLLLSAKCPICDGSGSIAHKVKSRTYVTREMAIDAGDESLEGSLYCDDEWEAEECQWCHEKKQVLPN